MLKSLTIKNFALIEDAEITFEKGLNIITGETGAGKSILLGALSMILGERASVDNIRAGSDKAIIEGVFNVPAESAITQLLRAHEIDPSDDTILVRRELSSKGQNRCFVNDNLISTAILKSIGDCLVDLHGQHEHQSLLRQELHIQLVDAFAKNAKQLEIVHANHTRVTELQKKIDELKRNRNLYGEKHELYSQQLRDIKAIKPEPGEDEQLLQEERLLGSSEKLFELSQSLYASLYEADGSVTGVLAGISQKMVELTQIDARLTELAEQFKVARITMDEVSRAIGDYKRRISFEPDRLERIRERILEIQRLKKKFGTIQDILDKQNELEAFVALADNFDEELERLSKELRSCIREYYLAARELSEGRKIASAKLDSRVVAEMSQLGIEKPHFKTAFSVVESSNGWLEVDGTKCTGGPAGYDNVEFLLSANPGEPLKPLVKIASGGEISRIMLSLKSALAESDGIPSLIFDEIDVGISGRIAQSVGKALLKLSSSHQLICITHLPQIAGLSQAHFAVHKHISKGKTVTEIRRLNKEEKLQEVAKLLGGEELTEANIRNAKDLIVST